MRIITGSARGTRLKSPPDNSTRPTADRVKESLFSILGGRVVDAVVLDLFAGTGALGLEALSRGAAHAVFVDKRTGRIIAANAQLTRLAERAEILTTDVFVALRRFTKEGRRFDVIFCDPPYGKKLVEDTAALVGSLMNRDALFVAEHGAEELTDFSSEALRCVRRVSYGRTTAVSIFGQSVP